MHSSCFRLFEGLAHEFPVQTRNFDIHLQGGDAVRGPRYFKIHITEMVFGTEDIRKNRDPVAVLDQPHGNARNRGFDRNPRIHQ